MITKGDIRLIRAYSKMRKQPWKPLLAAFRDAPGAAKAAQRARMREALAEGRG